MENNMFRVFVAKKTPNVKKVTFHKSSKIIENKIRVARLKIELRHVSRNLMKDFDAALFEKPKKLGGHYTEWSDYEK